MHVQEDGSFNISVIVLACVVWRWCASIHAVHSHYSVMSRRCHATSVTVMVTVIATVWVQYKNTGYSSISMML